MVRRTLVVLALVLLLAGALAPVSGAQTEVVGFNFEGKGSARVLDLAIPALGGAFAGRTVGLSIAEFSSAPAVKGAAAADCSLVAGDASPDSLPCAAATMQTSAAPGSPGGGDPVCAATLDQFMPALALKTACGRSSSEIAGDMPAGFNEAGVAQAGLSLDLTGLGLESTKDSLADAVAGVTDSLFGIISGTPIPEGQRNALEDALKGVIESVKDGQVAVVKLGLSTTEVKSLGDEMVIASQAAGGNIGLLGVQNALVDGLIMIDVSVAKASATWNNLTGQAVAEATPAIATLKVKDLVDLIPGQDYITATVTAPQLSQLLAPLNGTVLETTLEVATASVTPPGRSVSASTDGVSIHALKGVGATGRAATDLGCGDCNGGILLRVAAANVAVSGAPIEKVAPPLPITGGRPYAFFGIAAVLALGASLIYRFGRRLRRV